MNTNSTYVPTTDPIDNQVFAIAPNLSIFLDLYNLGVISSTDSEMINTVISQVYDHIDWSELNTIINLNMDADTSADLSNLNIFNNIISVSEMDTKYIPVVSSIIEQITATDNPEHTVEDSISTNEGWALFTYLNAYIHDTLNGSTKGSFNTIYNK